MADQNWLNKLAQMLQTGRPNDAALGQGAAANAAQSLQDRAYRMHVAESQMLGQQPLSMQEFAAQQSRGPRNALAPRMPEQAPKPFQF